MKIIHIILTSQNGGAEQVFIDYAKILKKIGHQNLAIIKHDAPYFSELDKLAIDYTKISNSFGYHDFWAIKQIKNYISYHQPDIILAHAGRAVTLVHKALKNFSYKVKNNNKDSSQRPILVAVNHSNNIKRSLVADLILSVNREIFFKTIDAGRDVKNSLILYNGVSLDNHQPSFVDYNFLNKEVINIGLIGRFHKAKGFDLALEAFKILKEKTALKNLKLKIAGDGEESENLKRDVIRLGLENEVDFLGWVKNNKIFFEQIDIFILPSRSETFGLVILEAMKNCKPIIATNCDGPREIIRDNLDGILVDLKSPRGIALELAEATEKIIYNPEIANNLVRNAYGRLEKRFTQKILEENLAEIFKI